MQGSPCAQGGAGARSAFEEPVCTEFGITTPAPPGPFLSLLKAQPSSNQCPAEFYLPAPDRQGNALKKKPYKGGSPGLALSNPLQLLLALGGSPVPSHDIFKTFCPKFIFVMHGNVLLIQGTPSLLKAKTLRMFLKEKHEGSLAFVHI